MLDSVSKVHLFFAGLVFAMLSFSIQFAVVTENRAAQGVNSPRGSCCC